jgi:hypothetical protein
MIALLFALLLGRLAVCDGQRQTIELIDATAQVDIGSYEVKVSGCDAEYRAVCLKECNKNPELLEEVMCDVKDEPIDCSGYTDETPICMEHITCICVRSGEAK